MKFIKNGILFIGVLVFLAFSSTITVLFAETDYGSTYKLSLGGKSTNSFLGDICFKSNTDITGECGSLIKYKISYQHTPRAGVDVELGEDIVGFLNGYAWSEYLGWIEFPKEDSEGLGDSFEDGCPISNKKKCYPRLVNELVNGKETLVVKGYAALIITIIDGETEVQQYNNYFNLNSLNVKNFIETDDGNKIGFGLYGNLNSGNAQIGAINFGIVGDPGVKTEPQESEPVNPVLRIKKEVAVIGESVDIESTCNDYSKNISHSRLVSNEIPAQTQNDGSFKLHSYLVPHKDSVINFALVCSDILFGESEKIPRHITVRVQNIILGVEPRISQTQAPEDVMVKGQIQVGSVPVNAISCTISENIPSTTNVPAQSHEINISNFSSNGIQYSSVLEYEGISNNQYTIYETPKEDPLSTEPADKFIYKWISSTPSGDTTPVPTDTTFWKRVEEVSFGHVFENIEGTVTYQALCKVDYVNTDDTTSSTRATFTKIQRGGLSDR